MMESIQQRLHQVTLRISAGDLSFPDLKTAYVYSGWAVMFALVVLDLLTAHFPEAGLFGTILWYLSYVYFLAFAALCLRDLFSPLWPLRAPLTVIAITIYVTIIAANMLDLKSMSGETAEEIACAVTQLSQAADHGFRDTCLYGYPARQFFLPAIPTLLFGRSYLDLHLLGDAYPVLGMIIFATGVLKHFRSRQIGDLIASILLISFLHVYFFNKFLLVYEQSIYPLSLGLIGAGLFLHYLARRDDALIMLAGFDLLYLIHSYTSSLSLFVLGLCLLAYLALRNMVPSRDKALFALLILLSLASFRLSLTYRQDLKLGSAGAETTLTLVQDCLTALDHIVFLNHGVPMLSPVFTFLFIFLMVSALLFMYGRGAALVAVWALATLVFAVISHGFMYYSIDFRLHRGMVIFPVMFALAALIAARIDWRAGAERYLGVLLLVLSLTGLQFHLEYRNSAPASNHLALMEWMQSHVAWTHRAILPSAPLYFYSGSWYPEFNAVDNTMVYFYPWLYGAELTGAGSGHDCLAEEGKVGVFALATTDPCFGVLQRQAGSRSHLIYDGIYTDLQGLKYAFFERD